MATPHAIGIAWVPARRNCQLTPTNGIIKSIIQNRERSQFGFCFETLMSHFRAYLILTVPLIWMLSIFNPMRVFWAMNHPYEETAPDYAIVERKVDGLLHVLRALILMAILFLFMVHQDVTAAQVGFTLRHWPLNLGIGACAGLSVAGLHHWYTRWLFSMGQPAVNPEVLEGSASYWIFDLFINALSEEFWIVVCMVAMTQLGHSRLTTVVIATLIFGSAHIGRGIAAIPFLAVTAVPSCLLFLWRGSILPLLLYHWIGNLGIAFSERQYYPRVT